MARVELLHCFLSLISDIASISAQDENTKNIAALETFLRDNSAKDGTSLCIPSFSAWNMTDADDSVCELSYPSAVLNAVLKAGNPLPPKTSYAKGKKKLQKRRNSSQSKLESIGMIQGTEDAQKISAAATMQKVLTKAEKIQENLGEKIRCHSTVDSTKLALPLSEALKTLRTNLERTVEILVKDQLVALTTKLVYTRIQRREGIRSDESARILACCTASTSHFVTEILDQDTVSKALHNWEPLDPCPEPPSKKFSSEEEDQELVTKSLRDFEKRKEKRRSLADFAANLSDGTERKELSSDSFIGISGRLSDSKFFGGDVGNFVGTVNSSTKTTIGSDKGLKDCSNSGQIDEVLSHNTTAEGSGHRPDGMSTSSTFKNGSEGSSHIVENRFKAKTPFHPIGKITENVACTSEKYNANTLGHVARITTIHNSSPSLRSKILSQQPERCTRKTKISIEECSTFFTVAPDILEDAERRENALHSNENLKGNDLILPLDFGGTVSLNLMRNKYMINLQTTGKMKGRFQVEGADSKLSEISISLDIKTLFQCLVEEINMAIKNVVTKMGKQNTKKLQKSSSPGVVDIVAAESASQNDHIKAAQTLSELESSGSVAVPSSKAISAHAMDSSNSAQKRERNSTESTGLLRPRQKRRGNIKSVGTEAGAVRSIETERNRRESGIAQFQSADMNMDSLFRQHTAGVSDLDATIQNLRRGSSGAESSAALAEAVRLAELDALQSMHGSSGLHFGGSSENAVTSLRRSSAGNSMAAAAEAVRIAEAENNLHSLQGVHTGSVQGTSRADLDAAINAAFGRRNSFTNSSMSSEVVRMAEIDATLGNRSLGSAFIAPTDAVRRVDVESAMRRGSRPGDTMAAAAEAVRLAEMESAIRRGSRPGDTMAAAAEAVRLAEMESAMRRGSRPGDTMAAAAEAVRLAEMESALRRSSRTGDTMAVAAEAVRLAEMESAMRRGSRLGDSMAAAAEAVRIAEMEADRRRRSSLTEAMRLVEMDAWRRSSAGTSMAAAAEAVRLAEMDAYSNQRRQSYETRNYESLDYLNALVRRNSGATSSIERERLNRRRSSSIGNNHMAAAAEAVRLADMENELTRQMVGAHSSSNDVNSTPVQMTQPMRNSSGRRVSFGPDTMRDQLGRLRRLK